MIPSPNLDDKTYADIMAEAIRLIPRYCPEWTNHNPADPGMTLLELFAWMSEMTIYRLNKVPDKTYLALLDLIGLSPVPPQPSKALLHFSAVEGYERPILVRKGLQVSAGQGGQDETILFETEKDLAVTSNRLVACIGSENGLVTDHSGQLDSPSGGFFLFGGTDHIERFLYVMSSAFGFLVDDNTVSVTFDTALAISSVNEELVNFLSWEYWNGQKWVAMEAKRSAGGEKRQDNQVFFEGPYDIQPTQVDGHEGFCLRGSLQELPGSLSAFDIDRVLAKLLFRGAGFGPDLCLCNTENMVFHELDQNKEFAAFVGTPKYNDAFYLASDAILSKEDSRIIINFVMGEALSNTEERRDLVLKYEFWNGREWRILGESRSGGRTLPSGPYGFSDTTEALSVSGEVHFERPATMRTTEIYGQEHWWLRIRISAGDFGASGQYHANGQGNVDWDFNQPIRLPPVNRIRLKYDSKKKPVDRVISWYDFTFFHHEAAFAANQELLAKNEPMKSVTLIRVKNELRPVTYLGFEKVFPEGNTPLYIRVEERAKVKPGSSHESSWLENPAVHRRLLSLKWEYWSGSAWTVLEVTDATDYFHESGFVEFRVPKNLKKHREFGQELFWIRLVFESGSFETQPFVQRILLNSVYAWNRRTYHNEVLGTSNGGLNQEFRVMRMPVLPGMQLMVREDALLPAKERELILAEEGPEAVEVRRDPETQQEEVWVRYHQVENFHASTSISRHYVLDYQSGKLYFGDGRRGMVPPRIKNNLVIRSYQTGGGAVGNVTVGRVSVLRDNVPYIASVTNPFPAEGGADLEGLDDLKYRAAGVFKSLNRAVTAEDFEWLAREASASVARAKCLSHSGPNGEIVIVVVPVSESLTEDLKEAPVPTPELLRRVKEFLDARKLIGTVLRIDPPVYKPVSVKLRVALKKGSRDRQLVKEDVEAKIRRALHPLYGGDGKGWPFGTSLTGTAVFQTVEDVSDVHHVEEIRLIDESIGHEVEKISLSEAELVAVRMVQIDERIYEF